MDAPSLRDFRIRGISEIFAFVVKKTLLKTIRLSSITATTPNIIEHIDAQKLFTFEKRAATGPTKSGGDLYRDIRPSVRRAHP